MTAPFTPRRRHGVEILDDPAIDPDVRVRSLADVARANALFGGTRAVLAELDLALRAPPAARGSRSRAPMRARSRSRTAASTS